MSKDAPTRTPVLSDDSHPWHLFIGNADDLLSSEQYAQTMRHVVTRAQLSGLLSEHRAVEKAFGRCLSAAPWEMAFRMASALALREEVPTDARVADLVRKAEAGFEAAYKPWMRRMLRTLSKTLGALAVQCPAACCATRLELHRSVPLLVDLSHTVHGLFMGEIGQWLGESSSAWGAKRTIPREDVASSLVWILPESPVAPAVEVLPGETRRAASVRTRRAAKRPTKRAPWGAFTEDGLYQRNAVWLYRHRIVGESKRRLAREYRAHGDARKTITRGIRLAEKSLTVFDPKVLELMGLPLGT